MTSLRETLLLAVHRHDELTEGAWIDMLLRVQLEWLAQRNMRIVPEMPAASWRGPVRGALWADMLSAAPSNRAALGMED